jgi:hypothetical protein
MPAAATNATYLYAADANILQQSQADAQAVIENEQQQAALAREALPPQIKVLYQSLLHRSDPPPLPAVTPLPPVQPEAVAAPELFHAADVLQRQNAYQARQDKAALRKAAASAAKDAAVEQAMAAVTELTGSRTDTVLRSIATAAARDGAARALPAPLLGLEPAAVAAVLAESTHSADTVAASSSSSGSSSGGGSTSSSSAAPGSGSANAATGTAAPMEIAGEEHSSAAGSSETAVVRAESKSARRLRQLCERAYHKEVAEVQHRRSRVRGLVTRLAQLHNPPVSSTDAAALSAGIVTQQFLQRQQQRRQEQQQHEQQPPLPPALQQQLRFTADNAANWWPRSGVPLVEAQRRQQAARKRCSLGGMNRQPPSTAELERSPLGTWLRETKAKEAAEYAAWTAKTTPTVNAAAAAAGGSSSSGAGEAPKADVATDVSSNVAGQALPWGFPPRLARRALGVQAVCRTLSLALHVMPFAPLAFLRALVLQARSPLLDELHTELLRVLQATFFKG